TAVEPAAQQARATRAIAGNGAGAWDGPAARPPWERAQFRFWVIAITVIAVLAVTLAMFAIIISHPASTKTVTAAPATAAATAGQKIDFNADAPAGFTARDPNAPAPLPGTVHNITMHINETKLKVAAGVTQTMWTFDGKVPGPVYRGKVGDTFNFTIIN